MSVRKLGIVLAAAFAASLFVPVAAEAQSSPTGTTSPAGTTVTSLATIPVTGTARGGKMFKGHLDVSQFVTRNGKAYAVGTLTGKLAGQTVKRSRNLLNGSPLPSNELSGLLNIVQQLLSVPALQGL